mmetsp:Transcript_57001/g.185253  ORF Transcript_57001/g.185253 Transcript_57001/m.185253 type:complete len:210 (-) Transcript_57001:533-1162(-)
MHARRPERIILQPVVQVKPRKRKGQRLREFWFRLRLSRFAAPTVKLLWVRKRAEFGGASRTSPNSLMRQLLVLVNYPGVVHPPTNTIANGSGGLCVHRQPPQIAVVAKDLLPIPAAADVEFARRTLLTLEVLDGRIVFENQLHVELDEVRKRTQQQGGHEKRTTEQEGKDPLHGLVLDSGVARQSRKAVVNLEDRKEHDNQQTQVHIDQ